MDKEKIELGDTIISDTGIIAYVDKILPTKIRVWINGKKDYILDEQLHHWQFTNPIKENRIVSDYTFAVRFKQFLKWIPQEWWMSQPHYYEEFEYMKWVAESLLKYQTQTVCDEDEIKYLKKLNIL